MEKAHSITVGDNVSDSFHDSYNNPISGASFDGTMTNSTIIALNTSQVSVGGQSKTEVASLALGATVKTSLNITHNVGPGHCRFPKLEECAHFHYERVQLGLTARLVEDKSDLQSNTTTSQQQQQDVCQPWFIIKVTACRSESFLIKRSFENLKFLDEMLHRCIFDRKISCLVHLSELSITNDLQLESIVAGYLNRFSAIVTDSLTCGPIITWFQLDNKGRRLPLADTETMRSINTPAVGAAYGIRKYNAQACDEISIEVGDMISVIDMPSPAESTWWRGKKSHMQKSQYEVGFFPQTCVATIGEKIPRHLVLPAPLVGSLEVSSPTKPVLQKHGKLIAFFRSFILSRPSRRRLKQSGIYKERVFSCDLSEHLLNSGQDIPMVLRSCAEFIEENGIVDGIYRLSGITSNIQKLRRCFDEERVPDLTQPEIRQDIHAMSSLLKMYFRELPNPLCTYQLYENFVEAIQAKGDSSERAKLMKEAVQKLPPPHYRTLKYLSEHLNRIGYHSARTGMTDRNLAIVWAPNLLRSPALESGGVAALRGVGVQAVVTEFLITNCHLIFDADEEDIAASNEQYDSIATETDSIVEHRDHDQSFSIERPKSLSVGGAKLISLEEAQTRHNRSDFIDINKSNPINTPGGSSSYIEVGGGPSSLPDKYHTVLPVPRSWQKRKTHSWRSLFTRGQRSSNSDMKGLHVATTINTPSAKDIVHTTLANQKSMEDEKVKHISLRSDAEKTGSGHHGKGCDSFDGKPVEICVRSSSADSLRTAGHSRSVSHDSYFDLLQSPLRGVAGSPSREFSELGINFDREEPEMRIFSESESLVSSPRAPKDSNGRRIARCRTDDYASAMHCSVNPSPKKQPRLNTPSPIDPRWTSPNSNRGNNISSNNHAHAGNCDESYRKRYKLENQSLPSNMEELQSLSEDFQFIDCITPEHTSNNSPNPIYACAQIHNPPSSQNSLIYENSNAAIIPKAQTNTASSTMNIKDDEMGRYSNAKDEDRFSYPGMGHNFKDDKRKSGPFHIPQKPTDRKSLSQNTDRYSYCDPKNFQRDAPVTDINLVLRSSSMEVVEKNVLERTSKVNNNITPSSPSKSPRYSLLVGETSSENSSSMNTPVYELDTSSREIGLLETKNDDSKCAPGNYASKDGCKVIIRHDPQVSSRSQEMSTENTDMSELKKELSLDLEKCKASADEGSFSSTKHAILTSSTSTTPNYTYTSGNTSQSMTPSEFGYHHLNRPSAAVSLDSSPKSDIYEQVFQNRDHALGPAMLTSLSSSKPKSPIKSTINITYNIKSPTLLSNEASFFPQKTANEKTACETRNMLETNFDESMVYEQIHVFNNTISEINNMLDNGNAVTSDIVEPLVTSAGAAATPAITAKSSLKNASDSIQSNMTHQSQTLPNVGHAKERKSDVVRIDNVIQSVNDKQHLSYPSKIADGDDVTMPDQELDNQDSLEDDPNISLYENVQLRKPFAVYENMHVPINQTNMNQRTTPASKCNVKNDNIIDEDNESDRPSSFTVRQLANKFQTSPNDVVAPFDFSKPYAKKSIDGNQNPTGVSRAKLNQVHLNRTAKITRSLDENAFVREFGNAKLQENINRSTHQIPDIKNILTENSPSRRSSIEYTRPKSLNPPKRLPDMSIATSNEICQSTDISLFDFDLKITPTTENPISLIQQNVMLFDKNSDDEKSLNSISSVKNLGIFKLDRDRIEKIKEERRLQLNEKFRSESFKSDKDNKKIKSKSKTELTDWKEPDRKIRASLQYKSKSRGEIYNTKDADSPSALTLAQSFGCVGRIRRISDEKNQNTCNDADYLADMAMREETEQVAVVPRKYDRRPVDIRRDQDGFTTQMKVVNSQRDRISPQYSIRDVAAIFESRSQNQ